MSDLGSPNYSETDASNTAAVPNGWPEGQAPSSVNNCARAMMGALKRFWNRNNSTKTTSGSLSVYTLTYDVAAASLYDGEEHSFVVHTTCGANPTLNVNGLGAKNLRKFTAGAFANWGAGDVVTGQPVRVRYNQSADKFDLVAQPPGDYLPGSGSITTSVAFAATATMAGAAFNEAKGTDIASAATTDIGAATGNFVDVTGTTTITALGTVQAGTQRTVRFAGALTLTHNAVSLILPTGANITTAAGDVATFRSLGSGNWVCVAYTRASGLALATSLSSYMNTLSAPVALNNTGLSFTGPSVAQGTTGTFDVEGCVNLQDLAGAANFHVRLTDGTSVYRTANVSTYAAAACTQAILRCVVTNPAGNLRMLAADTTSTSGFILADATSGGGNTSSWIQATRIG